MERPDPDLRVGAIQALQGLGAKQAIPKLRQMLFAPGKSHTDQQVSVVEAAQRALTSLGEGP